MQGAARSTTPLAEAGVTLVELVVVMAIGIGIAGLSAPVAASVVDSSRARQAAAFLSSTFRLARQQAVGRGVNVGVVFDRPGARWTLKVCRDGNANGIRRADVQSGVDPCFDGPFEISQLFPNVDVSVDATLRGPSGEAGSPDPVRFGASDIVSFSPLGSCTAGSVFLRSSRGAQYVIRTTGVTGRVRVLKYERAWIDP